MRAKKVAQAATLLGLCVAVSGCSRSDPQIMHAQRGMRTPDEFAILPGKPIEIPQNLTALPAPTPNGANRADANPMAEAVAALGGNPAQVTADGRLGSDGALISQTTRYGIQPGIRTELAAEDLEFRQRHRGRLLERWFNVPTYYRSYQPQELDQHLAQDRYLRSGIPGPASPPDPKLED